MSRYISQLIVLIFVVTSLSTTQLRAQDSIVNTFQFEQKVIDGKVVWKDSNNIVVARLADLQNVFNNFRPAIFGPKAYVATYGHWDNYVINPYKGEKLKPPFPIYFNQDSFASPLDIPIVTTSRFGRRRRGPHRGIDLDLVKGDNVRTILPGKVRFVGYSRGHGRTVIVRHANDVETVYAHLTDYHVKINDWVEMGQIIGTGGITGNARGSHLHLEIRYRGIRVHPEYLLDFKELKIRSNEVWVTNAWMNPHHHSSYRKSKVQVLKTEAIAIEAQKNEPRMHRVRRGDTLSSIGRRYNVYVSELCKLNSIKRTSILRIGQIIKVR